MSGTVTKRRSLSGQGGLLNRMFGSSNNGSKEQVDSASTTNSTPTNSSVGGDSTSDSASPQSPKLNNHINAIQEGHDEVSNDLRSPTRKSEDQSDKKRRSSGVGRARDLFSSAKQSLSNLGGSPDHKQSNSNQTPMQKLGRTDPALAVPTGSLNNSAGESVPGPRSTFRVGVTEDKNKKCRRTMEDTHAYLYNFLSTPAPALGSDSASLSQSQSRDSTKTDVSGSNRSNNDVVETDNGYFAIFDGHAGTFAAEWCGKKVHLLLEEIIRKHPNTPIPELLDMTFTSVDAQLEKLPLKNSGCTAVIAVLRWEDRIPNALSATGSTALAPATAEAATNAQQVIQQATRQRVLYTANVGDARIILCRNGKALRLSYDHKGSDENEGKRIAGAGGLILNNRVNGVLAVTRALGDAYMKDLVTGHPYTTETVIQPDIDEFLILACDGLWDVCSDQEAVDLVRNIHDPQVAAKALVEHALARFSTDNLSCMVVRFDNSKLQAAARDVDNPIGVEGDPPGRAGGVSEADAILNESKRYLDEGGQPLPPLTQPTTKELMAEVQETGPELNPEALEAAKIDNKPRQDTGRPHSPNTPAFRESSPPNQGARGGNYEQQGNNGSGNAPHNEANQGREEGVGMSGMPGNMPTNEHMEFNSNNGSNNGPNFDPRR